MCRPRHTFPNHWLVYEDQTETTVSPFRCYWMGHKFAEIKEKLGLHNIHTLTLAVGNVHCYATIERAINSFILRNEMSFERLNGERTHRKRKTFPVSVCVPHYVQHPKIGWNLFFSFTRWRRRCIASCTEHTIWEKSHCRCLTIHCMPCVVDMWRIALVNLPKSPTNKIWSSRFRTNFSCGK